MCYLILPIIIILFDTDYITKYSIALSLPTLKSFGAMPKEPHELSVSMIPKCCSFVYVGVCGSDLPRLHGTDKILIFWRRQLAFPGRTLWQAITNSR